MFANRMKERPPDLPDFTSPPVTEVILGVQFDSLERFLSPFIGLVWEPFKASFPDAEEHPPIAPTFETFGSKPLFVAPIIQIPMAPVMPRVFFVDRDRTQLLQVQRDRFIHNWRKIESGGDYPRFERMLETFVDGLRTFAQTIESERLGTVTPNQSEVTYINQIPVPENGDLFGLINALFPDQTDALALEELGQPEDLRFLLRYVMRDGERVPIGRLIISGEPARRADGLTIVQLSLTARGKPSTPDIPGVIDFLNQGRLHIVRAFAKLTSPAMHKRWGRTQ
jgi:uncharacterized protein (TIGR04255 family)